MDSSLSPLAVPLPDQLPAIAGVTVRVAKAGYKDWDRNDLTFIELCKDTSVAGLFTQSSCASYEVEIGREQIRTGKARALIVNAGNSNAFTGIKGKEAVQDIIKKVSEHLTCDAQEVYVSSTGLIGLPLPIDRARAGLTQAFSAPPSGWEEASTAICTTDTFPKVARVAAMIGSKKVELVGIIKGSGMIAPDMATMLGYIFTDAAIDPKFLQEKLTDINQRTFACITVDGDTSTSDTVLAFATGKAGNSIIRSVDDTGGDAFTAALEDLCTQLAQLVVRDGEGATKFITIDVHGAVNSESARKIALSIANSPLVKTAVAGEDANWGRIVMAIGKAGQPANRDKLSISFGGVFTAQHGMPVENLNEDQILDHLKGSEIEIMVDVGVGQGHSRVWTCDLTHGYIAINADYRS